MTSKSFEDLLQSGMSPVDLLRNSQSGSNGYSVVQAEYTNWRDEDSGLPRCSRPGRFSLGQIIFQEVGQ